MKFKFTLGFASVLLLLSSCSSMSTYKEEIIPDVYTKVVAHEGLSKDFLELFVNTKSSTLDLTVIDSDSDDYARELKAFYALMRYKAYSLTNIDNVDYQDVYDLVNSRYSFEQALAAKKFNSSEISYYYNLFSLSRDVFNENVVVFEDAYCNWLVSMAKENTKILDGGVTDDSGNSYTGFYFIYELNMVDGKTYYALVSLIEYDDDSKCEYEILAIENSLRAIHEYMN